MAGFFYDCMLALQSAKKIIVPLLDVQCVKLIKQWLPLPSSHSLFQALLLN